MIGSIDLKGWCRVLAADVLSELQQQVQSRMLDTARAAQAGVISAFDRLVSTGPAEGKIVGVALGLELELLTLAVGEPAGLVDRQYRFVGRLLELHREFAQRLFEVVEGADGAPLVTAGEPGLAPVVPLTNRIGMTGR